MSDIEIKKNVPGDQGKIMEFFWVDDVITLHLKLEMT